MSGAFGSCPAASQLWRVSTTTDSITTSLSGRSVRGLVCAVAIASTTFWLAGSAT
jgi:hypothetical protein